MNWTSLSSGCTFCFWLLMRDVLPNTGRAAQWPEYRASVSPFFAQGDSRPKELRPLIPAPRSWVIPQRLPGCRNVGSEVCVQISVSPPLVVTLGNVPKPSGCQLSYLKGGSRRAQLSKSYCERWQCQCGVVTVVPGALHPPHQPQRLLPLCCDSDQ